MKALSNFLIPGLIGILLTLLTYQLGYVLERSDFYTLIFYYGLFFLIYVWVVFFYKKTKSFPFFIGLALLLRFILIFAMPNLSDDVYRFIWDGQLVNQGINPFNYLPTYFIENPSAGVVDPQLYEFLNSPDYYTIYPPVNQAIFAFATWIAPDSYLDSAMLMKGFLFLFECGSIFLLIKLLKHFSLPKWNALIYALNPLIIIEITGNLHFEGSMLFFLLLSIWLLVKNKWQWSAVVFALSIVSKLLPLMFLPFLIKRLGWKKSIQYFLIIGLTLALAFSPLLNATFISNFSNSLDLYFQKFEFNASIYYVLRWIGIQLKGYNLISTLGPAMALIVLCSILYKAFREQSPTLKKLPIVMLFAISIYLFLATTIHPWYVTMPLALCCFTRFRFPIWWSGLIFLTYINYSYPVYQENLWVVSLEYIILGGILIYEIFLITPVKLPKRKNPKTP